jgi:hypothetical protein
MFAAVKRLAMACRAGPAPDQWGIGIQTVADPSGQRGGEGFSSAGKSDG